MERKLLDKIQLNMLRIYRVFVVLAILKMKQFTALRIGCNTSFVRDVTYDGIIPDDDSIYIDSFPGLSRIQCCLDCHERRPNCVGVLYNNVDRKCKQVKSNPNEIKQTGSDWQYFQKIQSVGGLYRNSFVCISPFNGHNIFVRCITTAIYNSQYSPLSNTKNVQ
jgi:hypothetical protein